MMPKEHAEKIAAALKSYGYLSGGDIVIDTIASGIRVAMREAAEMGVQMGLEEGIVRYAWWRGGAQYVGTTGMTLAGALVDARHDPMIPIIVRRVMDSEVGVDHNEDKP